VKRGAVWGLCALLCAFEAAAAKPARRKRLTPRVPTAKTTAAPPPSIAAFEPAQVLYLTADRAFINRGARDGVKAGQSAPLFRSGRKVSVCVVDSVADHSASCAVKNAQVGDRLNIDRKAAAVVTPRPALPTEAELARRRGLADSVPTAVVDFDGTSLALGPARYGRVRLSHSTFADLGSAAGPFQVQTLDATLFDLPLKGGFAASADLSVINYSRRPAEFRSPQKGSPLLWVRELALTWQPDTVPVVARLGRIRLRHAPGLSVLDGAQLGWRAGEGRYELGVFGGAIPDALALTPRPSSWTAGAYGMGTFASGSGADGWWFQPKARAGWAVRPVLGSRFETSAAVGWWWGARLSVQTQLDLSTAGAVAVEGPLSIDGASLDVAGRLGERLRISVSGRYRGILAAEALPLGATLPMTRSAHCAGAVSYDLSPTVTLKFFGGVAKEFVPGLAQGYAGTELSLPTVLSGRLWAAIGYQEEPGWVWGRSAYAQAQWLPGSAFSLFARAGWYGRTLGALFEHDLGVTVALDARPWRWVFFRASGLVRAPLAAGEVDEAESTARASPSLMGTITLGAEM
jgi:hypothetical protein